ncbi:glycosyltransferase family 4 protein [Streptococcus oralis]|jgi:putative glycosyltransferase|uniref:Glycosyltransferase, group 1 family protein n=1 Tax=Streptococcus mitis bv. 2 str. F0392 TaxID=768726 RepID=F9P1W2_STROR|nr:MULTISPECIES: glycosyltransferase family 4 protein [Streptococcus]EGR94201.1 glycosyltransferase, group 1 family protein [Streptococcus mitis bv. 2 str. F0392]
MSKKKIAYVTNNIAPFRVMLLDELAKYADVTLFYVHEIEEGVKAEYVRLRPVHAKLQSITRLGLSRTFQQLKEMDMVFFDGYTGREKMLLMSYMWLTGRPYAISVDGMIDRKSTSIKQKLLDRIKSYALGRAKFVLSTNQSTDVCIRRLSHKARIKRHIFSTLLKDDIKKIEVVDLNTIFSKYGIQKTEKNLLFVGRFIKEKGVIELLSFMKEQKSDPSIQLIMVGGTKEELEAFEKDLPSNIHIIPFLEKLEILELMRAADVFVLPTHSDTWGLVIVEALSVGIPIISTNRCNAALEFIKNGKNGYLMQELTTVELASKLNATLRLDAEQVARYNQCLMQDYNLEGSAKNLMSILEDSHV